MATEMVVVAGSWGTWEELLLGGAVLRHGTRDWDVVAAELRSRTLFPSTFTPEICKAKYEDLQKRYSGCTGWFEELRRLRMKELRQALEQSEDSIGSLESRLETLKAERADECHIGHGSNQTESPVPFQKLERLDSSSKEASKDGLSAGSFTQETQTNWPTECQIQASVPAGVMETKPECSESCRQEKGSSIEKLTLCGGQGGASLRKRRGKRKRKDCGKDVKEGSVAESGSLVSQDRVTASQCKENSTSNSSPIAGSSAVEDSNRDPRTGVDNLMGIYHSVVESNYGSIFRRRLDSQKRGRYKKMIRQHMDLDTLRLRIATHFISSAKEVFRDLLLLANNALVFYSKSTREHKSALLLRDLVMKMLRQHYKGSGSNTKLTSRSTMHNPPVKPRSIRRPGKGNCRVSGEVVKSGNDVSVSASCGGGKGASDAELVESVVAKKSNGRARKVGRGTGSKQPANPTKGRKKVRTK